MNKKIDKPIKETIEVLNLIDVLEYLESIGYEGIKDRIFEDLCETIGIKNDTYINYYFDYDDDFIPIDEDNEEERKKYEEHLNDLNTIKTEFDLDDQIVFYISW